MDTIDYKAIALLARQGRISWTDLAQRLNLSPPATADRVRKLEETGVIAGYGATLNLERLGYSLSAYVAVTFGKSKHRKPFLKAVHRIPEILECHHVAGEEDFLLKVVARDAAHLEQLLGDELRSLPGVLRTKTTVILSTQKSGAFLPLEEHEAASGPGS